MSPSFLMSNSGLKKNNNCTTAIVVGFLITVLFSSCGFQHRQYTHGLFIGDLKPQSETFACQKENEEIKPIEGWGPSADTSSKIDQIRPIALHRIYLNHEEIIEKSIDTDTSDFPKYHQNLDFVENDQLQYLTESEVNQQLKEAREEAWAWVLCYCIVGITLILGALTGDLSVIGMDSLFRSSRINREIRRKIKKGNAHPLRPYWYSYLEGTRLILWSPIIFTIILLLIPYLLYLYGN
jgi:hypothetical protein